MPSRACEKLYGELDRAVCLCYLSLMSDAVLECPKVETKAPDWHLAKLLHAQRIPIKEIVARANVTDPSLRKRIARENWCAVREDSKQILSLKLSNPQADRNETALASLATASSTARRIVSDELLLIGTGLGTIKQPKTLQGIEGRLDVLAKYVSVARPTYGWDSSNSSGSLSLTFLSSVKPAPVEPVLDCPAQPCTGQEKEGSLLADRAGTDPAPPLS